MPSDFGLTKQTEIYLGDLGIKWGWPKIKIGSFSLSLKPPREIREMFTKTAEEYKEVAKVPEITPEPILEQSIFQRNLPLIIISALAIGGFMFYRMRRKRRR